MDYQAIENVGRTLRRLLWTRIPPAVAATVGITSETDITSSPPPAQAAATQLSLFLYQVTENPYLKNRPMLPNGDPRVLRVAPLSLTLHYLMTPVATTVSTEHLLLGIAMQIMYDHAVLETSAIPGVTWTAPDELHIVLDPIPLEDLTKIWEALNQQRAYKLSVVYKVTPVLIDSTRTVRTERVVQKETSYGQPLAGVGGP